MILFEESHQYTNNNGHEDGQPSDGGVLSTQVCLRTLEDRPGDLLHLRRALIAGHDVFRQPDRVKNRHDAE